MRLIWVLMLGVLTACSSGGSGEEPVQDADELQAALEADNISDPSLLPTRGTARYDGYMDARLPTGDMGERTSYRGDLRLNVDFGAERNQVTGRASAFASGGGDRLDGDLRIRGGDLFRDTDIDDNYTFTGTVRGALSDAGTPYDIDAEINGEFRGRNQDGVTGVLFGDVVGPLGQDIFDGDFFAGRASD